MLNQRALAIREKVVIRRICGSMNLWTISPALVLQYCPLSHYNTARPHMTRQLPWTIWRVRRGWITALVIDKKALGPDHPDTIIIIIRSLTSWGRGIYNYSLLTTTPPSKSVYFVRSEKKKTQLAWRAQAIESYLFFSSLWYQVLLWRRVQASSVPLLSWKW